MITKKQLLGLWRSQNMPMHTFDDELQITLHVAEHLTLWTWDGKDSNTLVAGNYEIETAKHDTFFITMIGGNTVLSEEYRIFECRMFMPQKPVGFLIRIPNLGERYMQQVIQE